jgi:hypothetical protein
VRGAEKFLELNIYLAKFCEYFSISEVVVPNITGIQLFVMSVFMIGLCGIRKNLRGVYALRAGGATALILAVTTLHSSIRTETQILEFNRAGSSASVIIHKDNNAWIIAQGRRNDIRQLRTREIEPLLYRKNIKNVSLFLINEEAESEAHEFTFNTDFNPRIVALRRDNIGDGRGGENRNDDGYTMIDGQYFVSLSESCDLKFGFDGQITGVNQTVDNATKIKVKTVF